MYIVQSAKVAWSLTKDRELVKRRSIEITGFVATCEKINKSLADIFNRFNQSDNFGFWIFNKNGDIGVGQATSILYKSKEIGEVGEIEKELGKRYNCKELE